jgi:alpha-mannosidase
MLYEIMGASCDGSLRAAKIAEGLKKFSFIVDFEQEPEKRTQSYIAARSELSGLMQAKNGSTAPVFYGVGNARIDVCWLWPFQETIRKTARTFAQQLRLLKKYPEYVYIQSQPQLYQMCKESYPDVYDGIKEAVKEGRWICEGSSWVEPDTNMPSGESLIRQIQFGKNSSWKNSAFPAKSSGFPTHLDILRRFPRYLRDAESNTSSPRRFSGPIMNQSYFRIITSYGRA